MSSSKITETKQWLDLLPSEICERIAAHVLGGETSECVFNLAKTSPKQHKAVLSVLALNVGVSGCQSSEFLRQWKDLMLPSESFAWCTFPFRPDDPYMLEPLKSLKLRSATIDNDERQLRAIAGSRSLRELRISHLENGPSQIFETLSSLALSRLRLGCLGALLGLPCFFENAEYFNAHRNALAESCPGLESLGILCCCRSSKKQFWRIVPSLPALRELDFIGDVPHDVLPTLRALRSVKILRGSNPHGLGVQIGAAVTVLVIGKRLNIEEIAMLTSCPNLSKLSLTIEKGAEDTLLSVVRSLYSLRELRITWEIPISVGRDRVVDEITSVEPIPGSTLRIVEAAKNLEKLHMNGVRLSRPELVAILRCLGSRLTSFEMSVRDQDEPAFDRLEAIVHAASVYNPHLRCFRIDNPWERGTLTVEAGQKRRLLAAIRRLQQRSPLFYPALLEYYVKRRAIWSGWSDW